MIKLFLVREFSVPLVCINSEQPNSFSLTSIILIFVLCFLTAFDRWRLSGPYHPLLAAEGKTNVNIDAPPGPAYTRVHVQEAHLAVRHHLAHRIQARSVVVPAVAPVFYEPFEK